MTTPWSDEVASRLASGLSAAPTMSSPFRPLTVDGVVTPSSKTLTDWLSAGSKTVTFWPPPLQKPTVVYGIEPTKNSDALCEPSGHTECVAPLLSLTVIRPAPLGKAAEAVVGTARAKATMPPNARGESALRRVVFFAITLWWSDARRGSSSADRPTLDAWPRLDAPDSGARRNGDGPPCAGGPSVLHRMG